VGLTVQDIVEMMAENEKQERAKRARVGGDGSQSAAEE
jgi:hypothetical protein